MNSSREPVGSRHGSLITPAIIDRLPWEARRIHNVNLRRHCHQLGRNFRSTEPALEDVRTACRRLFSVMESRSRILFEIHPVELDVVPSAVRMASYNRHWLRQPEDWCPSLQSTPREQWHELLNHLFVSYAVPEFMVSAWLTRGPLQHLERDCFCAQASGRSIRSVDGFPRSVSRKTLHLAMQAPAHLTLGQAVWWAQLQMLAVSETLSKQVMTSRVVRDLPNHYRWFRLVEKFSAKPEYAAEFGIVADALLLASMHGGSDRCDVLLRLPLRELLNHSRRTWKELLKVNGEPFHVDELKHEGVRDAIRKLATNVWSPMFPEGSHLVKRTQKPLHAEWRMVELCSQAELVGEGRNMHHCVGGYASQCKEGRSAIFSLRHRQLDQGAVVETRLLTIQVAVRRRCIVQVRSSRNYGPPHTDAQLVRSWAEANGLRMNV